MRKSSETEKTHTCFLKIGEGMMQKWRLRCVTRSIWSNSVEREMGKTVNSHKNSRENTEKNFKNSLQNAKHAFFTTEVSR